ncbi:speedy protein 1-B-like [Engystomops pustulosus]|uniref:speedy protein 1-B-like n=1 Tax=Engystomops pustulosus TaxID=76066 RepID=UPI003AFA12CA
MKTKRRETSPPDPLEPAPKRRKIDLAQQDEKMAAFLTHCEDKYTAELLPTSNEDRRRDLKRKRRETSPPEHQEPAPKQRKIDRAQQKEEMAAFLILLEDRYITEFLSSDSSRTSSDKYHLATACEYLRRARLPTVHYRNYFFPALYLASQFEEQDSDIRTEILFWALEGFWFLEIEHFLRYRNLLFRKIGFKAWVDLDTCHQIMAEDPTHWAWKRERPT